ncbi:MAG TPA: FAD-dependent oxidoreductase [Burkholderiales bacterium]|nr:FAD-dependent oxidoreductase [Burkholderiales bacterium]
MAEIRLLRREPVAEGTVAFYFEKPAGFSHEAGQNAMFTLIDPREEDAAGPSRTFTIASAPHERELMIATRMRDSAFKHHLGAAAPGTKLEMEGPLGLMVLHEDASRPAVFLAGGIGITPFLAMVRDAAKRKLPHHIMLVYSNRRPQDAAFLAELERLQGPKFRLVTTMTDAPEWRGERRRISRELLAEHVPDLRAPVYYFAGPPGMTMAVQGMLKELGVSEDDMRSEEFYGY